MNLSYNSLMGPIPRHLRDTYPHCAFIGNKDLYIIEGEASNIEPPLAPASSPPFLSKPDPSRRSDKIMSLCGDFLATLPFGSLQFLGLASFFDVY